jgi:hypothetical protein
MASWQDLAGGEEIAVGGTKLHVFGIGIDGLNLIAHRFPEFVDMIIEQRVDLPLIVRDFPKASIVALAAGIGEPGNEECETKLGRLPLVDQIVLLEAIIRQTVGGDDAGPFVERLKRLFARMGLAGTTTSLPPPVSKSNGADHPSPSATSEPISQAPSST